MDKNNDRTLTGKKMRDIKTIEDALADPTIVKILKGERLERLRDIPMNSIHYRLLNLLMSFDLTSGNNITDALHAFSSVTVSLACMASGNNPAVAWKILRSVQKTQEYMLAGLESNDAFEDGKQLEEALNRESKGNS